MNRRSFIQGGAFAAIAARHGLAQADAINPTPSTAQLAPFRWVPPSTFDPKAPYLGLPMLNGVTDEIIYSPMPSHANTDEGGSGIYEDLMHGAFNHHPEILTWHDRCIVTWTSHSRDENGPGGRMLARHGQFRCGSDAIDWGKDSNLVELAPAAVPVRRRPLKNDTGQIYEIYPLARLTVINDRIYLIGHLVANHGWTNSPLYRHPTDLQSGTKMRQVFSGASSDLIPEASWSNARDVAKGFSYDVWWELGLPFVQEWKFTGDTFAPSSPLYKMGEFHHEVRITPSITESALAPKAPYANAIPFDRAPATMREDILHGKQLFVPEKPKYAPGTETLAADGKNSLAHHAEFIRPDGKWVVVRDNLVNPGHYYAALKDNPADVYPKAVLTNLYGAAMPACGELPDGRPWVLCNSPNRYYMYLTLSRDGIVFDKTWMIFYDHGLNSGGHFQTGGPAYFKTATVDRNIWVAYSISKQQIGVSRMPISSLDE